MKFEIAQVTANTSQKGAPLSAPGMIYLQKYVKEESLDLFFLIFLSTIIFVFQNKIQNTKHEIQNI